MDYPEALEELIEYLKTLPGIGRRGAERMALSILDWEEEKQISFGRAIAALPEKIGKCPECGAISEAGCICAVCSNPSRDASMLCVVETISQLAAIEKGNSYRGKYLVLGGRISPLDGEDGSSLNLQLLREKASSPSVKEVILALSADVEGRATAAFIAELLSDLQVQLSRPALGLPAGANLSYADGATITAAFNGRIGIEKY